MGSELKSNVVQSFTRAGSWGGSGGRDPPRSDLGRGALSVEVST
jgi:hypothetical protein